MARAAKSYFEKALNQACNQLELGIPGGRSFWEWPKFLNFVQYVQIMSNIFFQGEKFSMGAYGPALNID